MTGTDHTCANQIDRLAHGIIIVDIRFISSLFGKSIIKKTTWDLMFCLQYPVEKLCSYRISSLKTKNVSFSNNNLINRS